MTSHLSAALAYAARGWPVFPCRPGQKIPDTAHGVLDATIDPAQIRAWWTARPDRNIGIATGAPGPDVLDVDVKPEGSGYQAFAELKRSGLLDGHQAIIRTPSGGLHIYFAGTAQRNGRLPKHFLDLRASGGYVIAPPGTSGGRPYEITSQDSNGAGIIDWRAARCILDPPPAFQQPGKGPAAAHDGLRPGDDYATRTGWGQILAPHGWRRTRAFSATSHGWCRPGKAGTFISATTRDEGGLYVFSTSTPFDPEVPYSKFGAYAVLEHGGDHTAASKALRAAGYGTTAPLAAVVPAASSGHSPEQPGLPDYDLGALAAQGIKEPERIAGGMLYPASVHCLAGAPGGGKTTLMAWWMLRHIRDGGNVMLLDEESGPEQAAEKFLDLGATPRELSPPRFTYVPFPARGWNPDDLAQLHELITRRQPGIIGWDSAAAFLAIAGHDENSATDVTAFWQRVLVPCARQFSAAVVAIDHTIKTGEHGGYGRGSGAKKAASDVQYILETVNPFNRKQNGVLKLTTAPGKDRRGWLAAAYEIHVKIGETLNLDITEAVNFQNPARQQMSPHKARLWDALNAIGSEESPVIGDHLVDWIVQKHGGKGLRRTTVSTALNELAADGLADSIDPGPGRHKLWFPLTESDNSRSDAFADTPKIVSAANDRKTADQAQCQRPPTRHADASASGPFRGADDDDAPDADTPGWPAGSIGAA